MNLPTLSTRPWGPRAWVLADQALLSGLGFATTWLLLRVMGLEGFGRYALAQVGCLWLLGLQQAVLIQPMQTWLGARSAGARGRYLAAYGRLTGLTSLAGGALGWVAALAFGFGAWGALALAGFVAARLMQAPLRAAGLACGDRKGAFWSDAWGQGGGWLALWCLAERWNGRLESVLALQAIAWAVAAGLAWWRSEGRGERGLPLGTLAAKQWSLGRWLAGLALVRWCSNHVFLLVVAAQVGPAGVGLLRGLQALMGSVIWMIAALESVVPSGAALRLREGGEAALRAYLGRFAVLLGVPIALVSLGLVGLQKDILAWLFDDQIMPEAQAAMIAFACLPLASLAGTLSGVWLRTLDRSAVLFWQSLWIALLSLIAAPLAVQAFGVVGAAWGLALQPAAMAVMVLWHQHRHGALPVPRSSRPV